MNAPPLLTRLDARDRALFVRMALDGTTTRSTRLVWQAITMLGGTVCTITAALLLVVCPGGSIALAWRALLTLGASHLVVQLVKRFAVRERPTVRLSIQALIAVPDRFSFPSGHACAAIAVAMAYTSIYPMAAVLLLGLAVVVGISRVMLGVHYPGDVVVGQAIALACAASMIT